MTTFIGIAGTVGLVGLCVELATPRHLRRRAVLWASVTILGLVLVIVMAGGVGHA